MTAGGAIVFHEIVLSEILDPRQIGRKGDGCCWSSLRGVLMKPMIAFGPGIGSVEAATGAPVVVAQCGAPDGQDGRSTEKCPSCNFGGRNR